MFNGKPDDVFFVANHGDPPYLLRPLIPSTHEIEIAHQQTIQPRKLLVLRKSQMIGYKSIPTPLRGRISMSAALTGYGITRTILRKITLKLQPFR